MATSARGLRTACSTALGDELTWRGNLEGAYGDRHTHGLGQIPEVGEIGDALVHIEVPGNVMLVSLREAQLR